jgi:ubiquinone/menaquinone biosynthesis C-methylase UbiE
MKKNEVYRKHDSFYADEISNSPKQSFLSILNLIVQNTNEMNDSEIKVLDIGCATGEFPAFLSTRLSNRFKIVGMEYLNELIDVAKQKYPDLKVFKGSIEDLNCIQKSSVDIITVLGVISIFDELDQIISNLITWIKPNGRIFVHGMFNPAPLDVLVKYRESSFLFTDEKFENGWNIISQDSFKKLALKNGAKNVIYHDFELTIDLEKKVDPVRSWTEKLENGNRQIVNGICLKQPQYVAEIIC